MDYKRKYKHKSYFTPSKKKTDIILSENCKGFICTSNGFEKECVKEVYNILNEYADKLYGEEKIQTLETEVNTEGQTEGVATGTTELCNDSIAKTTDISEDFEKEIGALKSDRNRTRGERRFQVVSSGVANVIFVKTTLQNPAAFVYYIMKDIQKTQTAKGRYLSRIVPVEVTCKPWVDDIKRAAEKLFDRYFIHKPTTFSILFTGRNNSSINKDDVVKELAEMVSLRNSDHKVNIKYAKLTVLVEILNTVCCLSVVPEYSRLSKYNLLIVSSKPDEEETDDETRTLVESCQLYEGTK